MVSLCIDPVDREALEEMVRRGYFPSRSAAIRVAIKVMLVISAGLAPDAERAMLELQASEREEAAAVPRLNVLDYIEKFKKSDGGA